MARLMLEENEEVIGLIVRTGSGRAYTEWIVPANRIVDPRPESEIMSTAKREDSIYLITDENDAPLGRVVAPGIDEAINIARGRHPATEIRVWLLAITRIVEAAIP